MNDKKVHEVDLNILKYIIFLAMLYITFDLAGNIIIYRFIKISLFILPGGIFVLPVLQCIIDVTTEIFGYKTSRSLIWIGVFCDYIFIFFILLILQTPTTISIAQKNEYEHILNPLLHAMFGSTVALLCGRFLNVYCMSKWKIFFKGKYYIVRSIGSSLLGEMVVLIIGLLCIYGGVASFITIFKLFYSDYLFRLIFTVLLVIPTSFFVYYLKRKTGLDVYDYGIKYNIFKLN